MTKNLSVTPSNKLYLLYYYIFLIDSFSFFWSLEKFKRENYRYKISTTELTNKNMQTILEFINSYLQFLANNFISRMSRQTHFNR